MLKKIVFAATTWSLSQAWVHARTFEYTNSYALPAQLPNGWVWGCYNISSSLPFCDPSLRVDERVSDLIDRLTLLEKQSFLGADTVNTQVDACSNMDGGNARLGIPHYLNLVEANSAVASACVANHVCATEFPSPAGLAASFNRTLWQLKGSIVSTEMRALNNLGWWRGEGIPYTKIGLSGFGPNINLVRDPRFGRNSELPSEDPFLTGSYAIGYVRGMQFGEDPHYLKMISGLKHFGFYSYETDRCSFIPTVSTFDMYDSYLPQYEMAFRRNLIETSLDEQEQQDVYAAGANVNVGDGGAAAGVMCSYSGLNGVPSCANSFLLQTLIEQKWNRSDVVVVTDCGAINNMLICNDYAKSESDAARVTLLGGSHVDLGDGFFSPEQIGGNGALASALSSHLVTESDIDTALRHIFTPRFMAGLFDPLTLQPTYTQIGVDSINTTASNDVVLDAALQSFVLLRNDDNTLPLTPHTVKTCLLGPHVTSQRDLFEDYMGDSECFSGDNTCVRTIDEVFRTLNGGEMTTVVRGVDFDGDDESGLAAAVAAAASCQQIVMVVGLSLNLEHEGIDRTNTDLPAIQMKLISKVLSVAEQAANKKIVIVFVNGGMISFDEVATRVSPSLALVEAFYPAMRGAEALYQALFGFANRWGRLPVTIYPSAFQKQQAITDFDMTKAPGRTYRYYQDKPLFEFGFGLSYTQFTVDKCTYTISSSSSSSSSSAANQRMVVTCSVSNIGKRDGDLVLTVYHTISSSLRSQLSHPAPVRALVEFARIASVPAGRTSVQLNFTIPFARFRLTNEEGEKVLYNGEHGIVVTDGSNLPHTSISLPFNITS